MTIETKRAQTVTIIGMGRIGASIGLALKQSPLGMTIIGHDRDGSLAQEAKEKVGAVDKAEWNLISAVSKADILVLNIPAVEVEDTLKVIGSDLQAHALVLDLSSLKSAGLRWAQQHLRQGHYVGASPVLAAGALADGRTELAAARADLFKNSIFCLMPSVNADPKAVETAVNFGLILGASPYFVDPLEYDSLLQGIETVPGLMSAAMFSAVSKANSWRDILRFADQSFALTTQALTSGAEEIAHLAFHNKVATLRWLDALVEELQEIRRWVYRDEVETLTAVLIDQERKRIGWLKDRRQNEWAEAKMPDIEHRSLGEHLLGRWGRRDDRDEEK